MSDPDKNEKIRLHEVLQQQTFALDAAELDPWKDDTIAQIQTCEIRQPQEEEREPSLHKTTREFNEAYSHITNELEAEMKLAQDTIDKKNKTSLNFCTGNALINSIQSRPREQNTQQHQAIVDQCRRKLEKAEELKKLLQHKYFELRNQIIESLVEEVYGQPGELQPGNTNGASDDQNTIANKLNQKDLKNDLEEHKEEEIEPKPVASTIIYATPEEHVDVRIAPVIC